jgi:hypothetical protein
VPFACESCQHRGPDVYHRGRCHMTCRQHRRDGKVQLLPESWVQRLCVCDIVELPSRRRGRPRKGTTQMRVWAGEIR